MANPKLPDSFIIKGKLWGKLSPGENTPYIFFSDIGDMTERGYFIICEVKIDFPLPVFEPLPAQVAAIHTQINKAAAEFQKTKTARLAEINKLTALTYEGPTTVSSDDDFPF